ncbi:MAG: hypothetical protein JJE28_07770 [Actinomycetales bacterium]|nr:hypothetical protein [Actinomycetales bacterium]
MTPPQGTVFARSRTAHLSFVALTALVLAGCSINAEPAPPQATPVIAATPMFASDEEALVAAEAAYRNYIDVSDQIARDGGVNVERLEPFISADLYHQQIQEYADVASKGLRASGASMFDSFKLESYDPARDEIRAYVCIRVANIRVMDSAGNDVTPPDRNNDLPLQIVFARGLESEQSLSISQSEVWPGTNFC